MVVTTAGMTAVYVYLQAIHYASRSDVGSYRDAVVASIITKHNELVHSTVPLRDAQEAVGLTKL